MRLILADGVDDGLDVLRRGILRQLGKRRIELPQRRHLAVHRLAAVQRGGDVVAGIGQRIVDQAVQLWIALRRRIGHIVAQIAPHRVLVRIGTHHADEVEEQAEGDRQLASRHVAVVQVMHRVAEPLVRILILPVGAELVVVVHRTRDHADMQLLGALGVGEDVEGERGVAAIGQPLVDRQAVALGLRDLLALLVQEQLVDQPLRLAPAQHLGDLAGLDTAVGQVLAVHLIVHAQRHPAHGPVDLPLQLGLSAEDRLFDGLSLILEAHDARFGIDHLDRHLQHDAAGRAHRHDGRVGAAAFLAQRGQHDVHDLVEPAQHVLQRLVEMPALIALGRADELILEAKAVEEAAQLRVVVRGEAVMRAERIGDAAERLAQMLGQHGVIGHIVGHLAQAVHIVAERHQAGGRAAGERFVGLPDPGGALHFLKGADMRQAGGAVTGLEQHAAGLAIGVSLEELLRLLEYPGLVLLGGGLIVHGHCFLSVPTWHMRGA